MGILSRIRRPRPSGHTPTSSSSSSFESGRPKKKSTLGRHPRQPHYHSRSFPRSLSVSLLQPTRDLQALYVFSEQYSRYHSHSAVDLGSSLSGRLPLPSVIVTSPTPPHIAYLAKEEDEACEVQVGEVEAISHDTPAELQNDEATHEVSQTPELQQADSEEELTAIDVQTAKLEAELASLRARISSEDKERVLDFINAEPVLSRALAILRETTMTSSTPQSAQTVLLSAVKSAVSTSKPGDPWYTLLPAFRRRSYILSGPSGDRPLLHGCLLPSHTEGGRTRTEEDMFHAIQMIEDLKRKIAWRMRVHDFWRQKALQQGGALADTITPSSTAAGLPELCEEGLTAAESQGSEASGPMDLNRSQLEMEEDRRILDEYLKEFGLDDDDEPDSDTPPAALNSGLSNDSSIHPISSYNSASTKDHHSCYGGISYIGSSSETCQSTGSALVSLSSIQGLPYDKSTQDTLVLNAANSPAKAAKDPITEEDQEKKNSNIKDTPFIQRLPSAACFGVQQILPQGSAEIPVQGSMIHAAQDSLKDTLNSIRDTLEIESPLEELPTQAREYFQPESEAPAVSAPQVHIDLNPEQQQHQWPEAHSSVPPQAMTSPRSITSHQVVSPEGVFATALRSLDQVGVTFDSDTSLRFASTSPPDSRRSALNLGPSRRYTQPQRSTPLRNSHTAASPSALNRPFSVPLPPKSRKRFSFRGQLHRLSWFRSTSKASVKDTSVSQTSTARQEKRRSAFVRFSASLFSPSAWHGNRRSRDVDAMRRKSG